MKKKVLLKKERLKNRKEICASVFQKYFCLSIILSQKIYLDLAEVHWPDEASSSLKSENYFNRNPDIEFAGIDESLSSQFTAINEEKDAEHAYTSYGDMVFSEILKEFGAGLIYNEQAFYESLAKEAEAKAAKKSWFDFLNSEKEDREKPGEEVLLEWMSLVNYNDEEDRLSLNNIMNKADTVKKEHIKTVSLYIPALNQLCQSEKAPNFCNKRDQVKEMQERLLKALENANLIFKEVNIKRNEYIQTLQSPCQIDNSSAYCLLYTDNETGRPYRQNK